MDSVSLRNLSLTATMIVSIIVLLTSVVLAQFTQAMEGNKLSVGTQQLAMSAQLSLSANVHNQVSTFYG